MHREDDLDNQQPVGTPVNPTVTAEWQTAAGLARRVTYPSMGEHADVFSSF